MPKRLPAAFIVLGVFFSLQGNQASALQRFRIIGYAEMLKQSDLVVIVQVESDDDARQPIDGYPNTEFEIAVEAKATVRGVIKGSSDERAIAILHYRWRP